MPRTPEPQDVSFSTIDGDDGASCGVVYRLKRQRGLAPVDSSEPNTVEPAPKRLAVHQEDEDENCRNAHRFTTSLCNVGLNTPSLSMENSEGSTDSTLSIHDDFEQYFDLDLEETLAAFEADIFTNPSVTRAANAADDSLCSDTNFRSPPLSVLKAHGRESRSADEFDPTLQHSPSQRSSTLTVGSEDELVLDQEIDWESVYEHVQGCPKDPSLVGSGEARRCHTAEPRQEASTSGSSTLASSLPQMWVTKSFQDMRLTPHKTFFHVKEMLQTKADMYKDQSDVTFELFARVVYSSRENFTRKQYFQFRDLFKEAPPYLCGALLS